MSIIADVVVDLVLTTWIADAERTLYSANKVGADFSEPARGWGGAFTSLPRSMSYYDVEALLPEMKEKLGE